MKPCRLLAEISGLILITLSRLSNVWAAEPAELRLGFFPNITHAQALYARATGEYEAKLGVPVRWTAFNAGPTAIEALFSGAIDATYVGPGPAINGYVKSHGESFVIVSGGACGGAAMVVRNGSAIKTEKDFSGKTIATPQLGNTQDIAARQWLLEKGYKLTSQGGTVNLVPLANADQLAMFKAGQIDAAWTIEPWVSRLELDAGGKIFLEEKSLWPKGRYVTTHLVVSRKFLKQYPETVRKLIAAHVEVTQTINSNKTAAIPTINKQILKDTSKALADNVIERALGRVELTWDPAASSLYKDADAAYEIRFLNQKPVLVGIYELDILNRVLKEKQLPPIPSPKP
jgi:NitT/TauT family transport system substrate-binding protein